MASFLFRLARHFGASRTAIVENTGSGSGSGSGSAAVEGELPAGARLATVAAGCFWGVEHAYRRHFAASGGILDVRVGYTGGQRADPTYGEVCDGNTGHAEAARIVFDPERLDYRQLVEFFYRMHDPTTANRQGPDQGPQYRSAIYVHDDEQARVAREVTALANEKWWRGRIATEIAAAGRWWGAEEYHQLYLDKNPTGYQCPSHFVRDFPALED